LCLLDIMSRRNRRGGRGEGLPREVQVSKKLSGLLRHGAEKEGLKLGDGGYVSVVDVLNSRSIKPLKVTFEELRNIVNDNDKQRFSLIPITDSPSTSISPPNIELDDSKAAHFLIRANQGHTLKVDSANLLTPITQDNVPPLVVHGTTRRAWPLILSTGGLKPMGRNHVHFATGLPAGFKALEDEGAEDQLPVVSGMRNSSTILIYLDTKKALELGYVFGMSANGVVLADGGEKSIIPIECFQRVEERGGGGKVLIQDGVVVGEVSKK